MIGCFLFSEFLRRSSLCFMSYTFPHPTPHPPQAFLTPSPADLVFPYTKAWRASPGPYSLTPSHAQHLFPLRKVCLHFITYIWLFFLRKMDPLAQIMLGQGIKSRPTLALLLTEGGPLGSFTRGCFFFWTYGCSLSVLELLCDLLEEE